MKSDSATLNDVCEFIVDCLHASAPTQETGYPLIRTPNVGKGRLDLTAVHRVSEETFERWTKRAIPEPEDLILAREAPAGNVAIIKEGQKVCLGQRTVHIRPNQAKVDPDFLCYYILAPAQQGKLLASETGVTAKHVNMKDIRRLDLSKLPTLQAQRDIGTVLSAYDDKIENNHRRVVLLERAARELYAEWFVRLRFPGHEHTRTTNRIPDGWELVPLGNHVKLNYGKALSADNRTEGDCPVYGSSGIVGFHDKPLARSPGIVLGRKGNVGSVYWCSKDYWPIDTVYFIDADKSNLWLFYSLRHMHFLSTDVAVPGLNRDYAHSRPLLVPNSGVVREFLDVVEPIHEQIGKLEAMNGKLRAARDMLLPRLMSGELVL